MMFAFIVMMMAVSSCSTQKNNAQTRWWHSFTAKYNTYYNGTLAYIDASEEKEKGNKDNYTEMIPLYTVGNKASREIGKGNYDKAIEKSQKAIKLHSINKRPEWNGNKKKTERDIEWLNRKEYNPFLWKAWMLMGRSQFYKGAFDEAASTFAYMCRLYRTQPAIYGKARAWLAKCYIEQGWIYDAEDVIRNMQRDSIDWHAQKEWDYTYTDYYLHNGDLENASKYLRKVIKHEMRKVQKAREYYLLGQVEASLGHREEAYKAFKKVLAQNPPYELAFNARISMTEVLATSGQAKSMISKLKRMAHNDNNKDYLDQVYYAIGNIYLAQKDTMQAIWSYEKGNEKATRSGIEKGVLLLHLGDLYWQKERYGDAGRCYGEAIGLLDKDRDDYKQLSDRSKVLDELVPYTDAIQLQDSLQALARMSEKDRNEAIDRVITALKKKEKEEKDREAEEFAQKQQAKNNTGQRTTASRPTNNNQQKNATWYFYNPTAVQQGKQAFEKQWGKRENADNWQRSNVTVVGSVTAEDAEQELTEEQRDSIATEEKKQEAEKAKMDTAVNDPHKREYYLAQIPFTDEQIAESNELIKDGLFHSGIIFKDKLDNLPLSEKAFSRLQREFPDFDPMDEVLYHLFLLHSRKGDADMAQTQIDKMKDQYPDSKWTKILTDPYFEENARFGKHIEDSLYASTYDAFLNDRFNEVKENTEISDKRFPMGDNRDKFLFISGLSLLNEGDSKGCLDRMQTVVKEHPQSKVSEMAGMIINGVKEGRKLHGARFSMADVWNRRTAVMADSDSIAARTFSDEVNTPYTFMLVYEPDSVEENRLLYQMARFNFTSFVVRNFDFGVTMDGALHRMSVTGFRSFDEARQYARVLYQNDAMKEVARKCRPVVISDINIPLLGEQYSYNDYDSFYVEHFQSLDIAREYMLYEPDAVKEKTLQDLRPNLPTQNAVPDGVEPEAPPTKNEETEEENGNFMDINDLMPIPEEGTEIVPIQEENTEVIPEDIIIPTETNENTPVNGNVIIPVETEEKKDEGTTVILPIEEDTKQEGTVIIPVEPEKKQEQGTVIIPVEKKEQKKDDKKDVKKKEKEEDDEPIIIIDSKQDSEDLEDEYYELEGF